MKNSQVNFRLIIITLISSLIFSLNQSVAQESNTKNVEFGNRRDMRERIDMRRGMGNRQEMGISDLTDKQKEQIKSFKLKMKKEMIQLTNKLGEENAKLRTLTTQDNVDMKSVNKTIDQIGSLKTKVHKEKVATDQKIRAVLTDDQRIEFDLRKRVKEMSRGGGKGMGKGRNVRLRNARF